MYVDGLHSWGACCEYSTILGTDHLSVHVSCPVCKEIARFHVFTEFSFLLFSVTMLSFTTCPCLSYIIERLPGISAGDRRAFGRL